jgi:hypothetical protein
MDEFDIRSGCPHSFGRLFLERMQNVHRFLESDSVNRSVSVSRVVLNYLQHARTLSLPRLSRSVFPAELGDSQGCADAVFDALRKRKEFSIGRPNPKQRLLAL